MNYEIREDNSVELSGYISVCRCDSKRLRDKAGEFIEQIMPNAFKRSLLKNPNIPILFNHKWDRQLGRNGVNECRVYEDNIGLRYFIRTNDEEVVSLAKAGKLKGTSFGFYSLKETYETLKDGLKRRFVHDLQLLECSILSVEPAYLATSVEVRAEGEKEMELRVFPNEPVEETATEEIVEENVEETTEETVEENVEDTEVVEDAEVTTEIESETTTKEVVEEENIEQDSSLIENYSLWLWLQKNKK